MTRENSGPRDFLDLPLISLALVVEWPGRIVEIKSSAKQIRVRLVIQETLRDRPKRAVASFTRYRWQKLLRSRGGREKILNATVVFTLRGPHVVDVLAFDDGTQWPTRAKQVDR